MRSSGLSSPIDMRTMPAAGFASPATGRCVSAAGFSMSESTPPSDTACVKICTAPVSRSAASAPPLSLDPPMGLGVERVP